MTECERWPQLEAEDVVPYVFFPRHGGNHISEQSGIAQTPAIPRCLVGRVPAELDPGIWGRGHAVAPLEATAPDRLAQLAASVRRRMQSHQILMLHDRPLGLKVLTLTLDAVFDILRQIPKRAEACVAEMRGPSIVDMARI
jgi:hypothetical protein